MTHALTSRLAALCALSAALGLAACGGSDDPTPAIDARSTLAFGPCAVLLLDWHCSAITPSLAKSCRKAR